MESVQETEAWRAICLTCRRAKVACWCGQVEVVRSRARVLLLQHPKEARNPMGTARMAHHALHGSALVAGLALGEDPRVTSWMKAGEGTPTVVLYPAPHARNAAELRNHAGPINVVAIDGTWWQAQKLWKLNPWLHTLPAYGLTPEQPSRYRIRREPSPECVSTVEALGQLLDIIEDAPGRHAPLLKPFDALVEQQLSFAASPTKTPRVRKFRRPRRVLPPVAALVDALDRLVLVHGEGNGYSPRIHNGPPARLWVWTAQRWSTGEVLGSVVDTGVAPAPEAPRFMDVDAAAQAGAVTPAALQERMAAFSRPDDVWVCFGLYGVRLYKELGLPIPAAVLDAQRMLRDRLKDSVGTPERAVARLGLDPPAQGSLGRASRRLQVLHRIVEGLLQPHRT